MKKIARGSVLAYSLILLSILLIVSIGMMSSSIVDLKSLSSNDNSVNAFQIADSGSQAIVANIKKDNSGNIGDLATRMGLSCSNGLVESSLLNGAYKVSFYGDASTAPLSCTDTLSGVTSVKSVGSYRDSARAVSVAVAAGGCSGHEGQFVIVTKNTSSAAYNASNRSDISDFVNSGGILTGAQCGGLNLIGQMVSFGSGDFTSTMYGNNGIVCRSGSSQCLNGDLANPPWSPCNSGWKIFGFCGD